MNNTQYINTQKKFKTAECIGRDLFINYLAEKGVFDVEKCAQFSPFDLMVNIDDKNKKAVEIKFRWEYASTTPFIQSDGILFEEKKFNEISKFETTTSHQPYNYYYITLFNDGVGYSHKIDIDHKDKYNWIKKTMKKSTVAEWGDVEKKITYIPLDDCKKFYFNIKDNAIFK